MTVPLYMKQKSTEEKRNPTLTQVPVLKRIAAKSMYLGIKTPFGDKFI